MRKAGNHASIESIGWAHQARTCLTAHPGYAGAVNVLDRTVEAALRLIQRADSDDLFALITAEAVRDNMLDEDGPPHSSTTIRKAVGAQRGAAFRQRLFNATLSRAVDDLVQTANENASKYIQAADTIRRGGPNAAAVAGPAIAAAIVADLKAFFPSDALIAGRERIYYLALAMADGDQNVKRILNGGFASSQDAYLAAYQAFQDVTGRTLSAQVSDDQVFLAVSGYLEGIGVYRRFRPVSDDQVIDSVIRIFWAHTTPHGEEEIAPLADLFK